MEIKNVGVVGCGLMGSGIAQVCAQSGYQTVVSEVNDQLLRKGLDAIDSSLSAGVERGKLTQADKEATLARLRGTTTLEDFRDCDLVIEAAIENMEEKKRIFSTLAKVCPKDALLSSNTSCLSIIEMAMATQRPDRVIGMHFFNPVPIMSLIELVRSIASSEEAVDTARAFGESLGKTVVIAKDTPGFITNRLFIPYLLDAIRVLEAGVATREDIDQAIKLSLNHPMGPLTLADFIGLDTVNYVATAMFNDFKDPKYTPPILLKNMVVAGRLGRKTGRGFYEYK
jgi:3-hydroxybutyryl-CoA dehydrogenase